MSLIIMIAVIAAIAMFGQKTGISRTQIMAVLTAFTGIIGSLGLDIPAEQIVDFVLKIYDMGTNLGAESESLAVAAVNLMMIAGAAIMSFYRMITKTIGGLFGTSAKTQ